MILYRFLHNFYRPYDLEYLISGSKTTRSSYFSPTPHTSLSVLALHTQIKTVSCLSTYSTSPGYNLHKQHSTYTQTHQKHTLLHYEKYIHLKANSIFQKRVVKTYYYSVVLVNLQAILHCKVEKSV